MPVTKLSKKYQITVPRTVREILGLEQGSKVNIVIRKKYAERVVLEPIKKSLVNKYKGSGKDVWEKLGGADRYINKERAAWEKVQK